jgi:hypothetical protein
MTYRQPVDRYPASQPGQPAGRVISESAQSRAHPSPGGVAQLVERVLYHSTRRAVPERSWVQSLLPTTEVEPGFSTFGGMLVPVLQLISPVCKTGTSPLNPEHCRDPCAGRSKTPDLSVYRPVLGYKSTPDPQHSLICIYFWTYVPTSYIHR